MPQLQEFKIYMTKKYGQTKPNCGISQPDHQAIILDKSYWTQVNLTSNHYDYHGYDYLPNQLVMWSIWLPINLVVKLYEVTNVMCNIIILDDQNHMLKSKWCNYGHMSTSFAFYTTTWHNHFQIHDATCHHLIVFFSSPCVFMQWNMWCDMCHHFIDFYACHHPIKFYDYMC